LCAERETSAFFNAWKSGLTLFVVCAMRDQQHAVRMSFIEFSSKVRIAAASFGIFDLTTI